MSFGVWLWHRRGATWRLALFSLLTSHLSLPAVGAPAALRVALADALRPAGPGEVRVGGYAGRRIDGNASGILMHRDETALLEPFRHRIVGGHPWIGEYVGKWLAAAAMAYDYSADQPLRDKLDRVASGLVATQLEDGYLGTYGEPERFKRWDVWVHKYNLLGLQACYDATGDQRALNACRKMADLIVSQFGPAQADILESGTHDGAVVHQGMAATSILQPFVGLYLRTGDERYLAFADYIVDSLERDRGPHIVSTLLAQHRVDKVANAKAYEMISNVLGLLDMYRVRGRQDFLDAARIAFDDIVEHRSYVTGGSSFGEAFKEQGYLPNAGHVAEMCVMMSQLQLARELQLITGDARYGNAAEHLILNHLLAGQNPSGASICYYTPLWGHKFYMDFLACCISSGPRAIATIPSLYYLRGNDRLVVNVLGPSEINTPLGNGATAHVIQETAFPFDGKVRIRATAAKGAGYTLAVRIPPTAHEPTLSVNRKPLEGDILPGRYVELKVQDEPLSIEIDLHLRWGIIDGTGANQGLFALRYGPVVFAYDHARNAETGKSVFCAFDRDLARLKPHLERQGESCVAHVDGYSPRGENDWAPRRFTLVPFADAGQTSYFSVWLRDRARAADGPPSLFTQAHENVSRPGTHRGSIADNSPRTFTSTDTAERRDEDWFEVDAGWHCKFNVVVFRHGKSFPGGGWFDTSRGKPRVSLRLWGESPEVGVLQDYPDTTAADPGRLVDGQAFRFVISPDQRKDAFAVRITGKPACGNDPTRGFASCSEIQVFYDPDL